MGFRLFKIALPSAKANNRVSNQTQKLGVDHSETNSGSIRGTVLPFGNAPSGVFSMYAWTTYQVLYPVYQTLIS